MFDAVRNNRKIVQGFLFLIAVSFSLYGLDAYVSGSGAGNDVAVVGDSRIALREFQQSFREQMDGQRKQAGPAFRPEAFDTPENRLAVANALIDRRLLLLESLDKRVSASDALLAEIIFSMPSLQDENGKFSREKYLRAVQAQGMSVEMFEAQLRQDLNMQQLVGPVADAALYPAKSAEMMLRIQGEERQVAEVRLTPDQLLGELKLDANAERKFYEENTRLFETPERVTAEYVVFSLDGLLAQVKVSDEEIRQWYDKHPERFSTSEERRASHILFQVASGAPEAERAEARKRAQAVLADLQKSPSGFAEAARKHSQDPGSAANGGDLGFFGRGMMVKPFEESVFSLAEGALSGLVESDFGIHIIKLTGIKPARQRPLAEARGEIEAELKRQGAQRLYAEQADAFGNMVYEQSDSLQPAAEKFGLKIEKSQALPKSIPPEAMAALGVLGHTKLHEALFTEDAIRNRRNTEAIEVAPNTLLSARVVEHQPAAVKPFESVSADIGKMLRARESAALARQRGESILAELKRGEDKVNWEVVKTVSRLQGRQVPAAALQAIFRADVGKLPAYAGVELPNNGGYALYKIVGVKPLETIDANKQRVLQADYAALAGQQDFAAYLASLRARHGVEINRKALEGDKP